jgi:drug/metabolite transporter (DMT)-like permease
VTNIPLVLLLGIVSSLLTHLAKALERQGIEVFDQIRARLQKAGRPVEGGLRKPAIYTLGVILNNTLFVWSTLAQPYGPPALFSSMFGIGLVFLMVYARAILKEKLTWLEIAGAAAILVGTLAIGLDNLIRAEMDRFSMNLTALFVALGLWLALSLAFVVLADRARSLGLIALAYGLLAGGLGSLDPFFKGVGQNYGGRSGYLPSNPLGSVLFISSFVIGFLAFLVTQFGFAKKARASLLVPAYNAAFIGLPILWQLLLLPGYRLSWLTVCGAVLILAGVAGMQAFKTGTPPLRLRLPELDRS